MKPLINTCYKTYEILSGEFKLRSYLKVAGTELIFIVIVGVQAKCFRAIFYAYKRLYI